VVTTVARAGNGALAVAVTALGIYVVAKFFRRWWFIRSHRMARITPDELKQRIEAGDQTVAIIDTRSALDIGLEPYAIRGALRIPAEEIDRRHQEVPRDREVVLYCT